MLECRAAIDAAHAGEQDAEVIRRGAIDILAQHLLGMAVAGPFDAEVMFHETRSAAPYAHLDRTVFDRVLGFVATGGYALKSYDRFAKIRQDKDGRWRVANPRVAQQYRMNIGAIVEAAMLKVKLGRMRASGAGFGKTIGEIEEYFRRDHDARRYLRLCRRGAALLRDRRDSVLATKAAGSDPKVPSYAGGKFPLSTHLAARVRRMLRSPRTGHAAAAGGGMAADAGAQIRAAG